MLERRSASLSGREKANAVPWADFGFAPMSAIRFGFGKMELRLRCISLTSCEQMIFRFPPHGKALRPFLQGLDQNCLGHLKKFSHSYICLKVLLKVRNGQLVPSY